MDLITRGQDTEVVVHASAEALGDEGGEGECHLRDGPTIEPETARRMACDVGIVRLVQDPDGLPLDEAMAVEGLLQASGKLDEWA